MMGGAILYGLGRVVVPEFEGQPNCKVNRIILHILFEAITLQSNGKDAGLDMQVVILRAFPYNWINDGGNDLERE